MKMITSRGLKKSVRIELEDLSDFQLTVATLDSGQ